jgi:trigger factor
VEKNISYSASGVNTLEIFLSNAEILPFIDEGYRKIQHNVNIPGFRKGKVPRHMMEKMYGKAVENDANIDIVNEYFPKIAKEENIMLIDNPNLKDIQKTDDGVRYIIEFQTVPEFEISDYKTIELYEPQHVVTSDEVEVELEELSLKHAEYEDAESVDSHDFVVHLGVEVVNPEAEDHDHDHDHEGHHHHEHQSVYLRDQRVDSEFRNLFLNRKKGEDFIHTGTTQAGEFQYRYIIEGVQRVNPKPIDDELASLESNNQFTNLDDFRRDLEFRLQDYWDDKTRNEMENQIMDKITRDNSHIIVPASLKESALLSLIDNMKQQYKIKKDDTQFDDMLRSQYDKVAENYARWDMIKNKITKDESIEVEDYDIDDWIAKVKKAFPAYEDAMLRNLINQDENVKNQILSKKVFDFILGFATTNETTFEDFYKQRQMEIAESQKPLVDVEPYDPNEVIDAPEIEEETEEKKD